jgi:hypothetical protein
MPSFWSLFPFCFLPRTSILCYLIIPRVKRPEHFADQPSSSVSLVEIGWSYTSTSSLSLLVM